MKKFYVSFTVSTPYGIFIDAKSLEDANRIITEGDFDFEDAEKMYFEDSVNVYNVEEIED